MTFSQALLTSLYVPFQLLFPDPMILALSTYTSLLQGILYLFFGVFSPVFGTNHGFKSLADWPHVPRSLDR